MDVNGNSQIFETETQFHRKLSIVIELQLLIVIYYYGKVTKLKKSHARNLKRL
uniref:Uncharacterized protein n=1 Tax=Papilio xuthus TaxID=66420 RepID=I4DP38_PAPXU|nr:unknown unsecreted protein [Papilio xuthus]